MSDITVPTPTPGAVSEPEGQLLAWDSRMRRIVTVYVPLVCFLIVLLFPFYWMAITTFKPNAELLNYKDNNPFWINAPTLDNIRKLLFETDYVHWLATTMGIAFGSTFISLFASVLGEGVRVERLSHILAGAGRCAYRVTAVGDV